MGYKISDCVDALLYKDVMEIVEADIEWDLLNGKTVFISGANGFISYYLVLVCLIRNDLFNSNINVVGLVRNEEKAKMKFGAILSRGDIHLIVQDICQDIITDIKADFIVHAASQASAIQFENDPLGTINANLIGTNKVLDYALKCSSESTLFISSLKVYGTIYSQQDSIKEEDIGYINHLSYKSCYAQGKRAAEALCCCYSKQHELPVKIARPSYIYGASSLDDDRVWAQFIANVVREEDILLKSNGASLRSYCYVTDTAIALLKILLYGESNQPYNISDPHSNCTIREFAKIAIKESPVGGLKLHFLNKEDEHMPDQSIFDPVPEILDSSRLRALGWKAKVNLHEGVRRSIMILKNRSK